MNGSTAIDSPFKAFARGYAKSYVAVGALAVLIAILLAALFAPWISPQNPYDLAQLDIMDSKLAPGSKGGTGMIFWLGTDDQGRDMWSGILHGLRISLGVGVGATLAALAIGILAGLIAAYAGGWTETLIMRVVDLQQIGRAHV